MTPAGFELVTFRFVAQHLNHCANAVPLFLLTLINIFNTSTQGIFQLFTQFTFTGTLLRVTLEMENLFAFIQPKDQRQYL